MVSILFPDGRKNWLNQEDNYRLQKWVSLPWMCWRRHIYTGSICDIASGAECSLASSVKTSWQHAVETLKTQTIQQILNTGNTVILDATGFQMSKYMYLIKAQVNQGFFSAAYKWYKRWSKSNATHCILLLIRAVRWIFQSTNFCHDHTWFYWICGIT